MTQFGAAIQFCALGRYILFHICAISINSVYFQVQKMFFHISLEHEILLHPRYFGPQLLETVKQKLFSEVRFFYHYYKTQR